MNCRPFDGFIDSPSPGDAALGSFHLPHSAIHRGRSMTNLPPIHITLMQPAGYVHSLGLLDQARYVRYQLQRLGATVSIAKNRVREDAVNIVFGAHLGFPEDWRRRHACVFVNLEQLGAGGAPVSDAYLQLLRSSAVADYDTAQHRGLRCRCHRGAGAAFPARPLPRVRRHDADRRAADRPAVLRQHECAPTRLHQSHRGVRCCRLDVRSPAVR